MFDSSCKPSPFTVTITKNGKLKVQNHALSVACSLGSDETVLVAELLNDLVNVYFHVAMPPGAAKPFYASLVKNIWKAYSTDAVKGQLG
ncbi:hypothetical protein OROMI_013290 [Orobanche minor]